jgi:hypothetical protein
MKNLKLYVKIGSILVAVVCLLSIVLKHPVIIGLTLVCGGIWFIAEKYLEN